MKKVIRQYMSLFLIVLTVLCVFIIGLFYQQQNSQLSEEELKEAILSSDDVDISREILNSAKLSEEALKELSLSENHITQEALIDYDYNSSEILINICERLPDNILYNPQTTSDFNFQDKVFYTIKSFKNLSNDDCTKLLSLNSPIISQAIHEREIK